MDSFMLGIVTSVASYIMAYSYLTKDMKRLFNRYFANPIVDVIVTTSALILAGTTASSLFMAIGLGFGLSMSLRAGKYLYGVGE